MDAQTTAKARVAPDAGGPRWASDGLHDHREEATDAITLLKPTELAARLGVSRTWLYDAAKDGRVPSIRIGGHDGPLRFVPDDIERWIDEARQEVPPGRTALPAGMPRSPGGAQGRVGRRR
jgi:excisionase family DNA binding protein